MIQSRTTHPADLSKGSRLAFLLKDSVLYGTAASLSRATALITFPLLAHHLSVADYGILDFLLVISALLSTVLVFGQDSAVARYFYEYDCEKKRQQIISQSLIFQLIIALILLPVFYFGSPLLTRSLINREDADFLFKLILLQIPFVMLVNFSQNILKWTFSRKQFLAISLGYPLVHATLLTILLVVFDSGLREILLASVFNAVLFGLLGLFFVRRWLRVPDGIRHLREMMPFAIPFGVIGVIGMFAPALERSLTISTMGGENLGLYAAGTKIAAIMGLLVSSFQIAWGPFSLSIYKTPDAIATFNLVLRCFTFAICIFVLLLSLIADHIIWFLASGRYEGAAVVVFPLAMGLAVQAISWITEIGIGFAKRSHLSIYSYVFAMLISLVGILLLSPVLGLLGVSLAVMIGHIFKSILSSWLAQRAHPLGWNYARVVVLVVITLAFGLAALSFESWFGVLLNKITFMIGLLIVTGYGWTSLFEPTDRQWIIQNITRSIRRKCPKSC